jgi:hypothetical protein
MFLFAICWQRRRSTRKRCGTAIARQTTPAIRAAKDHSLGKLIAKLVKTINLP